MIQTFHQKLLHDLSPIAGDLAYRYSKASGLFNVAKADKELKKTHKNLVNHDLNLCDDDIQLREQSKNIAEQCSQNRKQQQAIHKTYNQCVSIASKYHINIITKVGSEYSSVWKYISKG